MTTKATKVILSQIEYNRLKREAIAYRSFLAKVFESAIGDPINEVVEDFRKTKLYSRFFLKDLEQGLRKSSYAKVKKYATKTSARRP